MVSSNKMAKREKDRLYNTLLTTLRLIVVIKIRVEKAKTAINLSLRKNIFFPSNLCWFQAGHFGQNSLQTNSNVREREKKFRRKQWLNHYVYKLTQFGKCSKPLILYFRCDDSFNYDNKKVSPSWSHIHRKSSWKIS